MTKKETLQLDLILQELKLLKTEVSILSGQLATVRHQLDGKVKVSPEEAYQTFLKQTGTGI